MTHYRCSCRIFRVYTSLLRFSPVLVWLRRPAFHILILARRGEISSEEFSRTWKLAQASAAIKQQSSPEANAARSPIRAGDPPKPGRRRRVDPPGWNPPAGRRASHTLITFSRLAEILALTAPSFRGSQSGAREVAPIAAPRRRRARKTDWRKNSKRIHKGPESSTVRRKPIRLEAAIISPIAWRRSAGRREIQR